MKKTDLTGKDLLLSFLYSPGVGEQCNEPIIGRTKLTKMMYLFEKEIYPLFFKTVEIKDMPVFEPYYFGPFSKQLFEDLSFFESIGMIVTEDTNIPLSIYDEVEKENVFDDEYDEPFLDIECGDKTIEEKHEKSYSLSKIGCDYVSEKIWPQLTKNQETKLREFKKQINLISLDGLLRYVYQKYPEDAAKSKIAYKYLANGVMDNA